MQTALSSAILNNFNLGYYFLFSHLNWLGVKKFAFNNASFDELDKYNNLEGINNLKKLWEIKRFFV